ncbi:MAG: response regulator [Treponema sp.]|jgi:two-component system chemotaxis response regulator CheY|nr:response regulator [Treponema sp.]
MITVLIVDDSQIMRSTVKACFSNVQIPCRYVEAKNGMEALESLEKEKVDVVLLDWNMPILSGIDFLRRVRGIEKYKKLPIIMVTSEGARYNVIEALKAGATDYIIKPITEKNFKEKIFKFFP